MITHARCEGKTAQEWKSITDMHFDEKEGLMEKTSCWRRETMTPELKQAVDRLRDWADEMRPLCGDITSADILAVCDALEKAEIELTDLRANDKGEPPV